MALDTGTLVLVALFCSSSASGRWCDQASTLVRPLKSLHNSASSCVHNEAGLPSNNTSVSSGRLRGDLDSHAQLKSLVMLLLASNPRSAFVSSTVPGMVCDPKGAARSSVLMTRFLLGTHDLASLPTVDGASGRKGACMMGDLSSDTEDASLTEATDLEVQLLRLAATTNRGATCSPAESQRLKDLILQLESLGSPDVSAGALDGAWKLAYATCPAYRSSPFFWAFGQLAEGLADPLVSITDGLPFYRIGAARQILTDTESKSGAGKLVSAIEVDIYIFDALLPPQRSVMTTTAIARPDVADASSLILDLQTTEVKDSFLPFSDLVAFPIANVFDRLKGGSATVQMRTSYLSSTLRIARTPDGDVLVYVPE